MPPARRRRRRGADRVLCHLAAARDPRRRRGGRADRGQPEARRRQRRGARLRREERRAALELGPGASGLDPARRLAGEQPALHGGHRERLVDPLGRRSPRPGLRAHRQRRARLLRRQPAWPRPLLQLDGGARRRDGRRALALPDRSPRRLGLRRPGPAHAGRPARAGAAGSRRRAGDQDGARLPAGSRDGRALVPGRGAPGAGQRRPWRDALADAALPDPPAAAAPAAPRARGRLGLHAVGSRQVRGDDRGAALRGPLHAAQPARLDRVPEPRRRPELGRRLDRSRSRT